MDKTTTDDMDKEIKRLKQQIKALKRIVETGRQVLLDLGFSGEELDQALKNG